jgi:23S rRNA (cytidine1920-2'-O)/16S rRNA (cytidine1409-2'-O)-methyltransferase
VEVGFGQLAGRLRADPRVRSMERTNLGDLTPAALDPPPSVITLDLSYLSLTTALPLATALLDARGDVLALVKPLFEVDDPAAGRTGHVDDPALVVSALQRVLDAGVLAGLTPLGLARLALRPRHGVSEFFAHFTNGPAGEPLAYDEVLLAQVVASAGIGSAEAE